MLIQIYHPPLPSSPPLSLCVNVCVYTTDRSRLLCANGTCKPEGVTVTNIHLRVTRLEENRKLYEQSTQDQEVMTFLYHLIECIRCGLPEVRTENVYFCKLIM